VNNAKSPEVLHEVRLPVRGTMVRRLNACALDALAHLPSNTQMQKGAPEGQNDHAAGICKRGSLVSGKNCVAGM
jgi:hypothetical protein